MRGLGVLCTVLASCAAHASRTDIDWLARPTTAPLIDATGGSEKVDAGRPMVPLVAGPGAAQATLVADMRIATHDEVKALLPGTGLSGAADSGGVRSTIAALLDRLPTTTTSSAEPALRIHRVGETDSDCVLYAESAGLRRLLGVGEVHKAGESAGRESAMGLDLPVHCLVAAPPAAFPARIKPALPPAPGQGPDQTSLPLWPLIKATIKSYDEWWLAPVGTALLMVLGLVVVARVSARQRAGQKTSKSRRL